MVVRWKGLQLSLRHQPAVCGKMEDEEDKWEYTAPLHDDTAYDNDADVSFTISGVEPFAEVSSSVIAASAASPHDHDATHTCTAPCTHIQT